MNLMTYLVGDLNLSSSKSANTVTNFMGTLNLLALLGGFLADAILGRYLTVAIFATIAALVCLFWVNIFTLVEFNFNYLMGSKLEFYHKIYQQIEIATLATSEVQASEARHHTCCEGRDK